MRPDREDIAPLAIIVVALVLPLIIPLTDSPTAFFKQATSFYASGLKWIVPLIVVCGCVIYMGQKRQLRREKALTRSRGEQTKLDFVNLFVTEPERQAAALIYPRLQSMTASGRMTLKKEDALLKAPFAFDEEDLYFEIEELCFEADLSPALNPEVGAELFHFRTVDDLVMALAQLIARQKLTRIPYNTQPTSEMPC